MKAATAEVVPSNYSLYCTLQLQPVLQEHSHLTCIKHGQPWQVAFYGYSRYIKLASNSFIVILQMSQFGHIKDKLNYKRKLLRELREHKEAFNLSSCDQIDSFPGPPQTKSTDVCTSESNHLRAV